jgi:hypothetical protein
MQPAICLQLIALFERNIGLNLQSGQMYSLNISSPEPKITSRSFDGIEAANNVPQRLPQSRHEKMEK